MKNSTQWLAFLLLGFMAASFCQGHDLGLGAGISPRSLSLARPYLGKWQAAATQPIVPIRDSIERMAARMVNGVLPDFNIELFRDYSYRAQFFDQIELGTYRVYGDGRYLRLSNPESPGAALEIECQPNQLLLKLPPAYLPHALSAKPELIFMLAPQ